MWRGKGIPHIIEQRLNSNHKHIILRFLNLFGRREIMAADVLTEAAIVIFSNKTDINWRFYGVMN